MIQSILSFLKSRFFIAIICILLAAGIAFLLMPHLNAQTREVITVIRAKETISANTPLTADMFTKSEVGSYGLPYGVITDIRQIEGKYAAVDILPTDNITSSKLMASAELPDGTLYTLVQQERIAVSISVPSLASSVSGKLRAGDIISVYAYFKDDESGKVMLYPELAYIQIAAVSNVKASDTDTYTGDKGALSSASGNDAVPAAVTLLATQAQAKRLIEIENTGIAHIALMGRGEAAIAQMNEYVIPVQQTEQNDYEAITDVWSAWRDKGIAESDIVQEDETADAPDIMEETEG